MSGRAAGCVLALACAGPASAQDWATRPIPELISDLDSPDYETRGRARALLFRRRDESMPALAAALDSGSARTRLEAVRCLERVGRDEPSALDPATLALALSLKDAETGVRTMAARALGRAGERASEALPHLREAVEDPDPEVRREVAKTLWLVGRDRSGVPVLARDLAHDAVWWTRRCAAVALAGMGEAGAEGLGDVLMLPEEPGRWRMAADEPDPLTPTPQDEAVQQLPGMGEAGARQLARALGHPQAEVRRSAAGALRSMEEASTAVPVEDLAAALSDPDWRVRSAVADVLAGAGPRTRDVLPQLLAALDASDAGTRCWVVRALGSNGPDAPGVERALRRALGDACPLVRVSAAGLLCERWGDTAMLPLLTAALRNGEPIEPVADLGAQAQAICCLARVEGQERLVVETLVEAARRGNDVLLQVDRLAIQRMGPRARAVAWLLEDAAKSGDDAVRAWARRALELVG